MWQALAHAWLDVHDRHHISRVGLHLARHGVLLTWNLDDFADLLLDASEAGLRHRVHERFLVLATPVIGAQGGATPAVQASGPNEPLDGTPLTDRRWGGTPDDKVTDAELIRAFDRDALTYPKGP